MFGAGVWRQGPINDIMDLEGSCEFGRSGENTAGGDLKVDGPSLHIGKDPVKMGSGGDPSLWAAGKATEVA